jgi:WD40 repeat protein
MPPPDSPAWSGAARDTNLLFALFGHLLGYINAEQFTEAIANWTDNPSVSIADLLVDHGVISKASRLYLDGLISHTLDFYEGNVTKTLESLGGHERVATILKTSADSSARELVRTRLALKVPDSLLEDEPAEEVTISERRGRYTGSSEYSRGGMGRILLVHDELLARDIALKELLPPSDDYQGQQGAEPSPMRQSAALVARFLREARITGRLEHPSIVPVYELGRRENGGLYYTMRLVRGKTLRTVLQECKTLEDRLKLLPNFVDLCMGIAYAHSRGVVHRDIKPSNIMIGEFGETVIIDWGLAKVVGQKEEEHPSLEDTLHRLHGDQAVGPDKTLTGEVLGSPHYMSPEQAGGRITEIDARSDVFSLGALLYEILAEHAAFDKSSIEALIEQIQHEDPVPISKREPHVPKELASICYRAIQKDKAGRYSSAKQMGEDVNRFLSGSVVSAYAYTPLERLRRFYSQRRALVNVSASAIVAIFAIASFAFVTVARSRDQAITARERETVARDQAQSDKYVAEIRLAQSYIDFNQVVPAEDTLWKIDPERRNWEWGHLLNRSRPEIARIEGYTIAALSPDGRRVVAASPTKSLALLSLPKGEILREFPGTQANVLSVAFSKEGKRILASSRNTTATIWDAETGVVLATFTGHRREVQSANFTPDETRVITTVSGQPFENTVGIWDAVTAKQLAMLEPGLGLSGAIVNPDGNRLAVWLTDSPRTEPEVQVWDLGTFQMLWKRAGNRPAFVPGTTTLLYLVGAQVVVADTDSGREIAILKQHQAPVLRVSVSADGRRAVSGAADGGLAIWDIGRRSLLRYTFQPRAVHLIAINRAATNFAATSPSGSVTMWDMSTGLPTATVPGHNDLVTRLEFAREGNLLLTSSRDRSVCLWNAVTSPGTSRINLPSNTLNIVSSEASQEIAFALARETITITDARGTKPVEEFSSPNWTYFSTNVALSKDGHIAALLLDGFTTMVWDRKTHRVVQQLIAHRGQVNAIDIDSKGTTAVTAGWDGHLRFWSLDSAGQSAEADFSTVSLGAVRMAADGKSAIVGAEDGTIRVVEVASGKVLHSVHAHEGPVNALTLDATGTLLASASVDKHAKVWRLPELSLSADLSGHVAEVRSICFSADASRVFTAGADSTIRIWDPRVGTELVRLAEVKVSSVHSMGQVVFGGADDGAYAWEAAPYVPLQSADEERSRFDSYRAESFARQAGESFRETPLPKTVFLSIASARRHIQSMRDALTRLDNSASPADVLGGLPVPNTLDRPAQVVLGLDPGDLLIRVQGEQMLSRASLETQLSAIAQTLEGNSPPAFIFEVRHAGQYREFRYVALPAEQIRESVSISRAEAIERLARTVDLVKTRRGISEAWTNPAKKLGIELAPGSLAGLFTSEQKGLLERRDFLAFGIAPPERITHFDGVPITSLDGLLKQWDALIEDMGTGRRDQFTMRIERGEFQVVDVTVSLS